MFRLLIFGGTTEGRKLAEYCAERAISAAVSVATRQGAALLPEGVRILCGRLDEEQMKELIRSGYPAVIDATHPYAVEATANIRRACEETGARYLRLIRESSASWGKTVPDMDSLIELLNGTDEAILSTLGSKALPELTRVKDFRRRLWVRVLPTDEILDRCQALGYDREKVIRQKGPFTAGQNVEHLRKSGAGILLTKESGAAGGYPEKAEAARICGAELITLARPQERGYSFGQMIQIIEKEMER